MGSGSTRKVVDRPLIRTPKGSRSGGEGEGHSVADVCIPSFDVRIEYEGKDGVPAYLQRSEKNYQVIVDRKVVGGLSMKLSVMTAQCEMEGVLYVGKVVYDKKTPYARFNRSIA